MIPVLLVSRAIRLEKLSVTAATTCERADLLVAARGLRVAAGQPREVWESTQRHVVQSEQRRRAVAA